MNLNLKCLELADFFVGIQEVGNNHGPEVEMFLKATGLGAGNPWCMASVQWIVRRVGARYGVKSSLYPSDSCLQVWEKSPDSLKLEKPEQGAIVIWEHGQTEQGHTGFVLGVSGDSLLTYEGNTGPGAGVVREGDGYYRKTRKVAGEGDMKVLGFLMAFPTDS